jgi:hypothetical protein
MKLLLQVCVLVFTSLAIAPPTHAHHTQEPERDWRVLDLLGWYDMLAGKTGIVAELHMGKDTITDFDRKDGAWLKSRGRFEKLNLNRFVFIPSEITDEKGGSFLFNKDWCNFMSIEVLHTYNTRPSVDQISVAFFMSEANARANVKTCGGGTYSFYGLEHRDASN